MRGTVLLLAAGGGERLMRTEPKGFVDVAGIPMVRRAADAVANATLVERLVVAVPPGCEERATTVLDGHALPIEVVAGGATRQESAALALAAATDADAVVVHDAARVLCPPRLFDDCLRWLDEKEAVCTAFAVWDTLKEMDAGWITTTLDRSRIVAAQTPQAFRAGVYRHAHDAAARDGVEATDDAALVERIGVGVWVTMGDPLNFKITTQVDLQMVEALLSR